MLTKWWLLKLLVIALYIGGGWLLPMSKLKDLSFSGYFKEIVDCILHQLHTLFW